jgi:hypothetical protein
MAVTGPFVWGAGGAALTPEDIARQRELEAQLVAKGVDTSPVGSWTQGAARVADALAGAFRRGRLDDADKAGRTSASSDFASALAASGVSPSVVAGPSADAAGVPVSAAAPSTPVIPGGNPDVASYIQQAAAARGIDPNIALRVAGHEGLNVFDPSKPDGGGDEGSSFGPFQLHYSGMSKSMPHAGLGDEFTAATGLDARDPSTWQKQIDFSLDYAKNKGWGPWMGAKAEGITGKMGIGQPPAPNQVASLDPSAGMGSLPPAAGQLPTGAAIPIPQPRPDVPGQATLDPATASPTQMMSALGIQPDPSVDTRVAAAPQQAMPPLSPPVDIPAQPATPAGPVQQVAQAMTQPAPAAAAPVANQAAIIKALSNPFTSKGQQAVLASMLTAQQARQQAAYEQQLKQTDPIYQQTLAKAKYENDHLGQVSPDTQATLAAQEAKAKTDAANALALADHQQQLKAGDPLEQANVAKINSDTSNANVTPDIKEFNFAKQNGYTGSFADWQISNKRAGATTNNIDTGEGNKFYNTLDEKNAAVFSGLSDNGIQGRSKLVQIDQLDKLLQTTPTGALAVLKQKAGDWGINTEGLSDIQAATALLSQMIPQQRPPGSGPVSDADLAGFRNSLPRMINTPGGNTKILNTMRGLTKYQIDMGAIADQVANREITPSDGRAKIANLPNPLADFTAPPPVSSALDSAKQAIAKGAPRDAVIQRLKENGIDPAGL